MEAVGEERDQIAEHVAGGREAVQQQQLRGAGRARLAVEDGAAVDLGGPIVMAVMAFLARITSSVHQGVINGHNP